jgi:hypothetical protein
VAVKPSFAKEGLIVYHNYNYKLVRYEKHRDKDGNIVNIFLAVQVWDNAGNSLYHEYWLKKGEVGPDGKEQEDEVAAVVADEQNLIPILERVIAEAMKRLEDEVANKPKPPIIASAEECGALRRKISADRIARHLEEKAEKDDTPPVRPPDQIAKYLQEPGEQEQKESAQSRA